MTSSCAHRRCKGLLEATLAPRSGLAAFNILGNAILAEVDEALADSLPGAPVSPLAEEQATLGHVRGCAERLV